MTFPTDPVNDGNVDEVTDKPSLLRTDLLDLITKFNQLIAHISAYMQGLLASADKATAQSALGIPAESTGSFTATFSGVSGIVTDTIKYVKHGNIVRLYKDTNDLTGTSNATSFSLAGLPAGLQPGSAQTRTAMLCNVIDNGANKFVYVTVLTGGVIFATEAGGFSGFTASGQKGLQRGWSIEYPL